MDEIKPISENVPVTPSPQPGLFGTKIPSSVAFAIGVLLFFMPFVDIKCNGMTLQTVSGIQLATGFKVQSPGSDNSLLGGLDKMDKDDSKITKTGERKDPNMFALAALGLGVVGLLLSLFSAKSGATGGLVTGILSSAALIATMIDVKSKIKMDMPEPGNKKGDDITGIEKFGQQMSDGVLSVDFTASFYIAIIAFLAAAFFCYKRMQVK